jgi:outer membrane biosynthesis protein TonB
MVKWVCRVFVLIILMVLPVYVLCQDDDFGFDSLGEERVADEVSKVNTVSEDEVNKEQGNAQEQEPVVTSAQPNEQEAPEQKNESAVREKPMETADAPEAKTQAEPVVQKVVKPAVTSAPEQKKEATASEDAEIKGIDTVNLKEPQGNWLFKRIWWERAEEKYEKARTLAQQVFELRMAFLTQRSDLDKNVFDPFYLAIGLSQGELKTVIADLLEKIEKMRATLGSLTPEQREFFEQLILQKTTLEQIALDVTAVNMVDQEIEKYLTILFEQMNRVRGYEHDAWNFFKEISRELSDKKAREIYFKMDTILKNIASIQNYLVKDFTPSFSKQVEIAQSQVERLKTVMQELKDKGFDVKVQFEKMVADQAKQNNAQPVPEPEEEPEQEQGFFSYYIISPIMTVIGAVGSALKSVWDGVVYIVWWPIEKIMGTSQHEQESEEPEPVVQPVQQEPITPQENMPQQQPSAVPAEAAMVPAQPQERVVEQPEATTNNEATQQSEPAHEVMPTEQLQQSASMLEGAMGVQSQENQELFSEHTAPSEELFERNVPQEQGAQAASEAEEAVSVTQ